MHRRLPLLVLLVAALFIYYEKIQPEPPTRLRFESKRGADALADCPGFKALIERESLNKMPIWGVPDFLGKTYANADLTVKLSIASGLKSTRITYRSEAPPTHLELAAVTSCMN